MAYQNPKFESPNPGPKHHCRVEQREANITPLHQFKAPLFRRILSLRTSNFEIRSRWEEIKTEVPPNKNRKRNQRTEKFKLQWKEAQ